MVERILFRSGELGVGRFRCPPGAPAWTRENHIGPWHLIVFPRTAVLIDQADREPVVANPNHAVFYNPYQPYRREAMSAHGDDCVFVSVSLPLLREVLADVGPGAGEDPRSAFPFAAGPVAAHPYLLQHTVVRHLLAEDEPDVLAVREALYRVLRHAAGRAFAVRGAGPRRAATARAHDDAAEHAKEVLSTRYAETVSLDSLAAQLHLSPYHLCRVFRARTGFTLRAYRDQLRLRTALDLLAEGCQDLAALAADLGFTSHSHLADRFRLAFGTTPTAVRGAGWARRAELRKKLEAPPRRTA
jgi:AraC family transcriptional regulator